MYNKLVNLFLIFDGCELSTKICFVIMFLIICSFIIFALKQIISFLNSGLNLPALFNQFIKLVSIVIKYEVKSIPGIINLTLFLSLILITISRFNSVSIPGIFGKDSGGMTDNYVLLFITILVGFVSSWALYKYYKINNLINK